MVRYGDRKFILVREGLSEDRHRSTVAHELGHFLMHPDKALMQCTNVESLLNSPIKSEREAEEFAFELILPEQLFMPKIKDHRVSLGLVRALSADFRASLTATAIRFAELSREPCAVVISDGQTILQYKTSGRFPLDLKTGKALPRDSSVSSALKRHSRTPIIGHALWGRGTTLEEESISLGKYGKILTLLQPD
jgi:hypothetical protein